MNSSPPYIHGSSDAREVERLERQARYLAPKLLAHFPAQPGDRVLDLGTGVGAMAHQLLRRFPGITVVGVDLRESQLAHARQNHPEAQYVQSNAAALPFPDESFDRVHASWLLEHIPEPGKVIAEVRRVLKTGGTCQIAEVDNATLVLSPPQAELMDLFDQLNRAQQVAGGDPYIGPKLKALFEAAKFSRVEVAPLPLGGDATQPDERRELLEEHAAILESADEAVDPSMAARLNAGAERVRALADRPDTEIRYVATLLRATK